MKRLAWTALMATLMLTAAVPSAFANGNAQNSKFRVSLADLPAVVTPGQAMRGTLAFENLTDRYQNANVQFLLATPLGNAVIRSTTRDVAPHFSKTIRSVFTVARDARPGEYRLIVNITSEGETLTVAHDFRVQ